MKSNMRLLEYIELKLPSLNVADTIKGGGRTHVYKYPGRIGGGGGGSHVNEYKMLAPVNKIS